MAIERDALNGVPENDEEKKAEMFLESLRYRAMDINGEWNKDKAIEAFLKMKEMNSFEMFGDWE